MEYALLAVLVGKDIYLLQANGIVETLLVDDVLDMVLLTSLATSCWEGPLTANDIDAT